MEGLNVSERPEWLKDYRRRMRIVEILDKAFDPSVPDKEIRDDLKDIAEELGELWASQMAPISATAGREKPSPRKRRKR